MSFIGSIHQLGGKHIQTLADLVYEEVFDQVSVGDEEPEVDVFVAIRDIAPEDREPDGTYRGQFQVMGYVIARVGRDLLLTDQDSYEENLRQGDLAIREYIDISDPTKANGYMFLHRHPEGHTFVSEKDEHTMRTLIAVDFINGNYKDRQFVLMGVMNRNESRPLVPDADMPDLVGVFDLDVDLTLAVMDAVLANEKIMSDARAVLDEAATAELDSLIERSNELAEPMREAALNYRFASIDEKEEIIRSQGATALELLETWTRITAIVRKGEKRQPGFSITDEMESQLIEELRSAGLGDLADLLESQGLSQGEIAIGRIPMPLAGEPIEEGPLGPDTLDGGLQMFPDGNPLPPARPSSVFDLPAIDDLDDDDTEVRWN